MYTKPGIYQDRDFDLLYCCCSSKSASTTYYNAIPLNNSKESFTFVKSSIRYCRITLLHASPTLAHAQEHFPELFI